MRTTQPIESTQWWRLSISDVAFLVVIAGGIFYLALPAPKERAQAIPPLHPPPVAAATPVPVTLPVETPPPSSPPLVATPVVGLPSPSPEPVASIQIAAPEPPAAVTTPPATTPSEVDRKRADGEQRLEQSMLRLENEVLSLTEGVRRYQYSGCSEAGAYGVGASIVCSRARLQLGELVVAIGRGLEAAEDDARRSWVDPGTVRDVRSKHGLDAPAWDRVAELVARLDERARTRH